MTGRLGNTLFLAATLLATAAVPWLAPGAAHACGGFFCNASQPVNQAAERIIFSQGEDGTVTAVIQIQYQGPSESFAWMLPVAGSPEVGVSSNLAFSLLQSATNPQYQLTTTVEGVCADDFSRATGSSGPDGGAGFAADASAGPPPVTVVDAGAVGPYDYVVISVDPAAAEPAAVAVDWLQANDYDVSDFGADRLSPYLEGGMNLLAFRLTKGNSAGSIRPVTITFGTGQPSIPIRPTAVAANDDMGVMVWVLGDHRAVPVNYMSLELNDALIDWINPNRNYNDVVTRAANEAGGQGFVTEMAGSSASLADTIYPPFAADQWDSIVVTDWTGREGELLATTLGTFGGWDGVREVLSETLPLPEGVSLEDLLVCVSCYYDFGEADIAGFEPSAFLLAMTTNVIDPMENTRDLFRQSPYVTRLYTTMSADEMTRDPVFDFNPELPDVSTIHNADRVIECSPSLRRSEAPWRVTLPNGRVVRGRGNTWPFEADGGELPANERIVRVGSTGLGEVVEDNGRAIGDTLASHNETIPSPRTGGSGLCAVSRGPVGAPAMLGMMVIALVTTLRRRRGRGR